MTMTTTQHAGPDSTASLCRPDDGTLDAALAAAAECGQREDWKGAREHMRVAVQLAPENGAVREMLGQLSFQLQDFQSARMELASAARLGAVEPSVFSNLAVAHLQVGDRESAETTLSVGLMLHSDNVQMLGGLAEIRHAAGRDDEALQNYARLAILVPGEPEYHVKAAECLRNLERWDEAQEHLAYAKVKGAAPERVQAEMERIGVARQRRVVVLLEGQKKVISVLGGSRYASCAIPLDYPPSRQLQRRWGGTRPPHEGLRSLFAGNHTKYREVVRRVRDLAPFFQRINPEFSSDRAPEPGWIGAAMNALDLAVLYEFVSHYRPSIYLEIGSGASTCFARRAVTDHQLPTKIVSIDPEPRAAIDRICDEVVRSGLETLGDLSIFERLAPGDIIFMDGSHRTFMNSDVTVFMLDILPRLKPGVIVHIHDIALPYDYDDMFLNWYWNEQYIVGTYLLAAAARIEVLMPVNFVANDPEVRDCLQPAILSGVGDSTYWTNGGSLWFTHR